MSSAFEAVFAVLVDGGMASAEAAQLLNQVVLEGVAAAVGKSQPTPGALRVRKFRERRAALHRTVTPEIKKHRKINNEAPLHVTNVALQSVTVTPNLEKRNKINNKDALHVTSFDNAPLLSLVREEERKENKKEAPTRGTRIRPDWKPSDRELLFARSRGLSQYRIETETLKFENYWRSIPGAKGVKLDWSATWNNWIIKVGEQLAPEPVRRLSPII